jgi:hypothetical protein
VIKEWDKKDGTGNTSCYLYTIGAHADALEHLKNDYPASIADGAQRAGVHHRSTWPARATQLLAGGVVPQLQAPLPAAGPHGLVQAAHHPEGARIIAFHGKPNPPDAIAGVSGKWYRRVLPTQWVADHWR